MAIQNTSEPLVLVQTAGDTYNGDSTDQTYILNPNAIQPGETITIVDQGGSNSIELPAGLEIASSLVVGTQTVITLSNGAVIDIRGADTFTYKVGQSVLGGDNDGADLSYADFAQNILGVTIPADGEPVAAGGASTVNDDGTATGGVDDGTVGLSIADASVVEGDAGNTAMEFTITLDEAATTDVTFDFNTEALTGNAEAGVDYVGTAVSPVTIAAGDTSVTVTVDVIGDLGIEDDETFGVTISNASANATITNGTATGTIIDDDTPTFELTGPSTVNEADGATYTVTASKPVPVDTDVIFQVAAGDASAPDQGTNSTNLNDFAQGAFTATTVTILAGQTTAEFIVASKNDGITELSEDFSVSATVDGTALAPVTSTILDGATIGDTFFLTTDPDEVIIETTGTIDTVRGLIDDANDNTFSPADIIEGNGLTEVRVTLVDTTSGAADFVEMEGVNTLDFRGAGAVTPIAFDANSYGSDLNNFLLSGADNADVAVNNVSFDDGPLVFEIAPGTTGDLFASGEAGPFTNFDADLDTTGDDGASLISDIGNTGIQVFAGENADVELDADIDISETSTDVLIDALLIGDVSLVAGTSATADVSISLSGDANTTGSVSIGDVTVGMVDMTAGNSGNANFSLYLDASADEGDATVGNIMFGDVALSGTADSADLYVYLSVDADVNTGNATIGNTTFGNVDIVLADDAQEATVEISITASADTGNATIGDLLIGDISVDAGVSTDVSIDVYQYVSADTSGNAAAGAVTIGDIDAVLGDTAEMDVFVSQTITADSGNASAGPLTVGDVTVVLGENASFDLDLSTEVTADSGFTSTIGDVTVGNVMLTQGSGAEATIDLDISADASGDGNGIIGNVTMGTVTSVMGLDSSLSIDVSIDASGTGTMTSIGNVSIGDVTLSSDAAGIGAEASLSIDVDSDGTIGEVTIGAVDVDFLADSTFDYSVDIEAGTSDNAVVGAVLLGDVDIVADSVTYEVSIGGDLTAGVTIGNVMLSGDDVDWQDIDIQADANIGDVVIGDVMIDAATNLSVSSSSAAIFVDATGDIGSVTIGDVSIDFVNNETFNVVIEASDDIGDVAIGDINITASATASATTAIFASFDFRVAGDQDVGNISVGDVTLLNSGVGANFGSGTLSLDFDAGTGDDLGNVTIGDIQITSVALDFDTGFSGVFGNIQVGIGGNAGSVGDVVIGDISLFGTAGNTVAIADTDNDEANPTVNINGDQGSTLASMLIGNIDMILTNSVDSSTAFTGGMDYNVASGELFVSSDSAITVGDINVAAINDSTVDVQAGIGAQLFDFDISLSADAGADDITIGDITVTGGDVDTGTVVLDNLANLTGWLTVNGATVTVGDVDYSGYAADATIDVSGFEGAGNIMAGSGDTDITVNDTTNIVTLGDGDDTVFYTAEEQSGTTYAEIDKIAEFTSGSDLIDFSAFGMLPTGVDPQVGIGGTVADYATFLTTAQAAMTFDNFDVFTLTDGTNTYVAVNSDDDVNETIDFVIELTGVTTVATGDFVL